MEPIKYIKHENKQTQTQNTDRIGIIGVEKNNITN